MAGEADQIVQEVVLKGQDDVIAAFGAMEAAALKLVASLKAASGTSLFSGLTATVAAVSAAFAGGSLAIFKWSESAASAVKSAGNLADVAGFTIEEFSSLTAALKLDADSLGQAFKRMSVTIQNEWPQIQKAQRDAALLIQKDILDLKQAYLGLEQAQVKAATASQANAAVQIQNANSVKGAEIALVEAQLALRRLNGEAPDPQIDEQLAKRKALLAVEQASIALAEAKRKAQQDAILAENQIATAQAEAEAAAIKAAEAQKKLIEDQRNDIRALAKFVDDTARGFNTAGQNVNVTADNIVKGLIASLGPGAAAIEGFKGSFDELANSTAPGGREAFLKLLDVFHNLEDGTLKMAVAVKFFGRSMDADFIAKLSQGRDAAEAAAKRLRDLGIVLTSPDLEKAKDLKSSIASLSSEFTILSQKTALAIAPTFTKVMNEIRLAIEGNVGAFAELGRTINEVVSPAIIGLAQALTGKDLSEGMTDAAKKSADSWTQTFKTIGSVAVVGFKLVVGAAQLTAELLNSIFGKDTFTAFDVALLGITARFGGLLGIVIALGFALDKLTGGAVSEGLEKFIAIVKDAGEQLANLFKFLSGQQNFSSFLDNMDRITLKTGKAIDDIINKYKKSQDDIAAGTGDALDKTNAQILEKTQKLVDDIEKKVKDGVAKTMPPINGIGDAIEGQGASVDALKARLAGIGNTAGQQIPQVKQLGESIKLLSVGQGSLGIATVGPGAGGADLFKGTGRGVTTDARGITLFPPGVTDTAKSFGQAFLDAKKRTDELDGSLERLATDSDGLDGSLERLAKASESIKPPKVTEVDPVDFSKKWDEAQKQFDKMKLLPEGDTLNDIRPTFDKLLEGVTEFYGTTLPNKIGEAFRGGADTIARPFQETTQKIVDALTPSPDTIGSIPDKIGAAFRGLGDLIAAPFQAGSKLAADAFAPVSVAVDAIPPKVTESLRGIPEAMRVPFDAGATAAVAALNPLDTKLDEIIRKLLQVQTTQPPQNPGGDFGGGVGGGFAGGTDFPLVGPGSWTSDSIIARVSRGEAIIQSASVHALMNHFGGGIIGVLNNFHKLAGSKAGGVVEWINRMAKGPSAQNMSAMVRWFNEHAAPKFAAGGIANWSNKVAATPTVKDISAIARWMSSNQIVLPKFATGGLVDWKNSSAPAIGDLAASINWFNRVAIPKFAAGGIVDWSNNFPSSRPPTGGGNTIEQITSLVRWADQHVLPRFATGGMVEWKNATRIPALADFSKLVNWANRIAIPSFNAGGIVNWSNAASRPQFFADGVTRWMGGDIPRFATGAFVASSGGGVAAAAPPSPQQQFGVGPGLVRVDLTTNHGTFKVLAPRDTVADMTRASIDNQLTSAGTPPSWVSRKR